MRLYYISPSLIPSRTANSIHVVRMCEALSSLGNKVTLFTCREGGGAGNLRETIENYYGTTLNNVNINSFPLLFKRAMNLQIAIKSIWRCLLDVATGNKPDLIISRNLYAAYLVTHIIKCPLIFETHQLEYGFRKRMQRSLISNPEVSTIVISEALKVLLAKHLNMTPPNVTVLHDAAPAGIRRISREEREYLRKTELEECIIKKYSFLAAYFGHLYHGRGINVIQSLAERHADIAFLVFGGNKEQILIFRKENKINNLFFLGHIDPGKVSSLMSMMDLLLMPYQRQVAIGGKKNEDTARWMSPMKMFEYMAAGVPIISSDLPVLREVLQHNNNCLMAKPDNVDDWSNCVKMLINKPSLAQEIADKAYDGYAHEYNWTERAKRMLASGNITT